MRYTIANRAERMMKVWDGASKVISHAAALSSVMNDEALDSALKMTIVKLLWSQITLAVQETEKL